MLDRFFRRLNFSSGAGAEVRKLSPEHRARAEAYCDGVNHGLRRGRLWGLRALGYKPEPWTVADCVLLTRVIGYFGLAQSQGDIERFIVEMIQGGVPLEHLEEMFPGVLGEADLGLLRRVRLGERLVPADLRWGRLVPPAVASNCWALAPSRTASGRSLLANDPHLDVNRLPALWYEAALERDDRFCIGATMPGLPAVVVGRTNDVAWGVTYSCMDAHDAWIEDCRDGRYRRTVEGRERWLPFRSRTEVIKRKRKSDLTVTFYENDHGVLDGDPFVPGLYLTARWSGAAGTGAASLEAAMDVARAPGVAGAMEALGNIETAWNWVLADRHGSIGYQMSGLMPLRRAGAGGVVPLEGWDERNDWTGFAAPAELPRALDPETGFIVSANDDLNHLGRAQPITLAMGSDRAERIQELVAARGDWSIAETETLQMDAFSKQAERFMATLRPLLTASARADVLAAWDCCYDVDSTGAYLFERFYRALVADVFGAVCGADVMRFLMDETGVLAGYYDSFDRVLLDPDSVWFGREGRDAAWRRAAESALCGPVKKWGEHQSFVMNNIALGGRLPTRLGFDYGPVPLRGARATVHQGQVFGSGGRHVVVAPSLRFVTDFAHTAVYTCLPGGPSEKRRSRWYTSGIADWIAGRFKPVEPRSG